MNDKNETSMNAFIGEISSDRQLWKDFVSFLETGGSVIPGEYRGLRLAAETHELADESGTLEDDLALRLRDLFLPRKRQSA